MPQSEVEATAARLDVVRAVPFTLARDEGSDGLTFEGYAATWDSPTLIDSWEGRFTEQIARGAFAKTLRERTPVLQFDHGSHPMIGSIPIGAIREITEDDHGVRVVARLHADPFFAPVREAIASGSISGMSFRFQVVRDSWDYDTADGTPSRVLKEVRCQEVGPVVFPAYATTTAAVRSRGVRQIVEALDDADTRREVIELLQQRGVTLPAPAAEAAPETPVPAPPSEGTRETDHDAPGTPAHPSPFRAEADRWTARLSAFRQSL